VEILHGSGARTNRRDPGERTYILVRSAGTEALLVNGDREQTAQRADERIRLMAGLALAVITATVSYLHALAVVRGMGSTGLVAYLLVTAILTPAKFGRHVMTELRAQIDY
jgi:hypothetical protein